MCTLLKLSRGFVRISTVLAVFFALSHPAFAATNSVATPLVPGFSVTPTPPDFNPPTPWPTNNAALFNVVNLYERSTPPYYTTPSGPADAPVPILNPDGSQKTGVSILRVDPYGNIVPSNSTFDADLDPPDPGPFGDQNIVNASTDLLPPFIDAEGFYVAVQGTVPSSLYPGYDVNGVLLGSHNKQNITNNNVFVSDPSGSPLTNLRNGYDALALALIEDWYLPPRPPYILPPNNPGEAHIKADRSWDTMGVNGEQRPIRHTGKYLFTRGGKMGVITARNQVFIRAYYDELSDPAEPSGYRIASVTGYVPDSNGQIQAVATQGIIDNRGRWILNPKFTSVTEPQYYYKDKFQVDENGDTIMVTTDDPAGGRIYRPATEIDYDAPIDIRGLRNVSVPSSSGNKLGVIDSRGAWIIPPRFDSLSDAPDVNGHRQITIGSAPGIIDKDGRWIVYPKTSNNTIAQPGTLGEAGISITSQPAQHTTVVGKNATFTVVAEVGAGYPPLSYQWQKSGTNIAGATSATYTIANVQVSDAATYRVIVTNTGVVPALTATSNTVALTVVVP